MFTRCPSCRHRVLRCYDASHESNQTQLPSDGQMAAHVTAPPEVRSWGSLDEVRQGDHHAVCGEFMGA